MPQFSNFFASFAVKGFLISAGARAFDRELRKGKAAPDAKKIPN
jgi:hypothetical protein